MSLSFVIDVFNVNVIEPFFYREKSALKSLEHENPTWLSGVWQKFHSVGLNDQNENVEGRDSR